jgi:hypothetical protein
MQKILDALAQFDHSDDKFWTNDGFPKTGMVQRLTNDNTIKRDDILKAAPDFRRNADPLADDVHDDLVVRPDVRGSVADPPEPEPSSILSVADAQKAVVESQVRLRAAIDQQRDTRGRVARAVADWQQTIGASYSPEQAARDFIASSIADRQAAKDGRAVPSRNRPGPSVVDRMAFGHGRNINVGRYGAWRRGAKNIHDLGR